MLSIIARSFVCQVQAPRYLTCLIVDFIGRHHSLAALPHLLPDILWQPQFLLQLMSSAELPHVPYLRTGQELQLQRLWVKYKSYSSLATFIGLHPLLVNSGPYQALQQLTTALNPTRLHCLHPLAKRNQELIHFCSKGSRVLERGKIPQDTSCINCSLEFFSKNGKVKHEGLQSEFTIGSNTKKLISINRYHNTPLHLRMTDPRAQYFKREAAGL